MSSPGRGGIYKWLAAVGLLVWACLPALTHASIEDQFASGVAAARQQDHAAALRYFEAAARAGMRKALLYYNLGVSYYHTGQLNKAENAFQQAAASPELAALSYYNLGLIARDQGRREQAVNRFRQAETAAQTQRMQNLSRMAVQQMTGGEFQTEPSTSWLLWAEGSIGYDSNAALAADFANTTGGNDEIFGFSVYGQYDSTRLRLHALVNAEHYADEHGFNFDMLETGISLPSQIGARELRPGVSVRHMRLGGQSMQNSSAFWLESEAETAGLELKFYLEHEAVSAAGGYGHLDGTRSYIRANAHTPAADNWRLIWDIEFNEREDLSSSDEFYSFSPRRFQWQLEYRTSLTDDMDLRLAAALQDSRYAGSDIRANGMAMRRRDDRERLIVELGYLHVNDWRSRLELMYVERNSNFEEFDYDHTVLTLNLERSFGR